MRNRWIGFIVAGITLVVCIWAYPQLPARVATHWDFQGQPNGYSGRFFATFMFPIIIAVAAGIAQVLPKIDPKGKNYLKFNDTYWLLINGVLITMGVIHLAVIGNAIGAPVSVRRVFPVALGFLLIVVGNYLSRVQPNWFLGIRTPWTLSSDTVWRKTHRFGGWVFVIAGVLFIASAFVPGVAGAVPVGVIIALLAVTPVLYSLFLWLRERAS